LTLVHIVEDTLYVFRSDLVIKAMSLNQALEVGCVKQNKQYILHHFIAKTQKIK